VYTHRYTHEYTHAYTGFAYRVSSLRYFGGAIMACVSDFVNRMPSRILVRILGRIYRVYTHRVTHEYTHAHARFVYWVSPLRFSGAAIKACVSGTVNRILCRILVRILRLHWRGIYGMCFGPR